MKNRSRETLWGAVSGLMRKVYGEENINRLARDVKMGPATVQRMKALDTSIGIDLIDRVADFFGVPAWQLLAPGLDQGAAPELLSPMSPIAKDVVNILQGLPDDRRKAAYALIIALANPRAEDVARMLDAIPDDERRRKAYALLVQSIEFGGSSSDDRSAAPQPSDAPTLTPAPHR